MKPIGGEKISLPARCRYGLSGTYDDSGSFTSAEKLVQNGANGSSSEFYVKEMSGIETETKTETRGITKDVRIVCPHSISIDQIYQ